ncbi:ABC transporter substrate-binding protein [Streptomyces griseorubiginosus]|uniref:ABC transporter substrate-binding protein n=1 Tax=Streptomyces griseorubiginosus TaxID=67304 RepID=A0A101RSK5_9ACTN|nr:extracellular solute-binding protein [Streptomyces griseorubiginosus]KUN60967.1 ABC transporter substrate-binding protein [Streptomyces griseorubiginosus]
MKHSGRRVAIATTVAAMAVSLAACGGGSSGASSDGTVTLHVQAWKGGGAEPANVAEINKAFEKAHPKIKIDFEYITANDTYVQKLQPELLGGKAGDVIMVDTDKMKKWGASGYLADLSKESWAGDIAPDAKPFAQSDGKTLAMPMELIGIGMYANMNLLKKAGIDEVPADWPTFLADLGKLKKAGINPISLPDKSGWTGSSVFQASGSSLVYQKNKQWDADFLGGKASFAPDWQGPLDQLKTLEDKGYVNWKNELGVDEWSQGPQDFSAGKSAFWYQGAWQVSNVAKAGFPVQFAPWPGGAAGTKPNGMLFAGTMWAVNSQSQQGDAAREYVKFWSQSENLSKYLDAEHAESPFTGGSTPESTETTAFTNAFKDGRYRILPSNSWYGAAAETEIGSKIQAYLLGKESTAQTLKDIQTAASAK